MVSILAVREQQEAERRRERLVAARKIASAVSVSRAQLYAAGKQVQQQRVRQDVEERWRQSKLQQSVELERQVRANSAKMGDGMIEAAAHTTALHRTAVEEASAWDAEHELENARHRLATARVHVEQRQRERPAEERRERIANLAKSTEKQRKRAAPVPVAVACGGDRAVADMWPMNPSNDAMLLPRPADPWAPRVLFAAGGGAFPETRAISAMEAAEQLPRIPVEVEVQRAEAMAEEQSRLAARRAALVHQQELMAAEQQQQQKDELRNRRAEAAVTYRHPREEDEELAMEGPLTKAPTPFTAAAHGGHPSVSAAHHPATAMQRSRAAAAKADEAFEAEFLRPHAFFYTMNEEVNP